MTLACERNTVRMNLDRRVEARLRDDREVRLFEPHAGRFIAARTTNVSASGLCISLPEDSGLRVGRIVTLHGLVIGPRGEWTTSRPMSARVVWIDADPESSEAVFVGLELYTTALAAVA